jgi:hypothetical protein
MDLKEARKFLGVSVSKTRYSAREQRDLEFTIDIDYIMELLKKQNGKCALTGWDLEFTRGGIFENGTNPKAATMDRIYNSSGYVRGNVQLTCWMPNKLKGATSNNDFITMCGDIAKINSQTH